MSCAAAAQGCGVGGAKTLPEETEFNPSHAGLRLIGQKQSNSSDFV
jgi:hypothetical protein